MDRDRIEPTTNDDAEEKRTGDRFSLLGCVLTTLYVLAFVALLLGGWYALTVIAFRRKILVPTGQICIYSTLLVLAFAGLGRVLNPWAVKRWGSTTKKRPQETKE